MTNPPDPRAADIIRQVAERYDIAADEIMLHRERGRPMAGTRRARIVAAKGAAVLQLLSVEEYGLPVYSIPGVASLFGVSPQHMRKLVKRARERLDGVA